MKRNSNSRQLTRPNFVSKLSSFLLLLLVLSVFAHILKAQYVPPPPTNPGSASGAAAGSFPLSGFESVNLYSGKLSFNLPLAHAGGRGEAGVNFVYNIEANWYIQRRINSYNENPFDNPKDQDETDPSIRLRWGMSVVGKHYATTLPFNVCENGPGTPVGGGTVTKLVLTTETGAKLELSDTIHNGAVVTWNSRCDWPWPPETAPSRGTIFKSRDGSGITFVSDTTISDIYNQNLGTPMYTDFGVTGYLLMPGGARYRIENNLAKWVQDRNGNRITFYSDHVTDSVGRDVSIGNLSDPAGGSIQYVQYKGTDGAIRQAKIYFRALDGSFNGKPTLRSDYQLPLKTYPQLFPEIYNTDYTGTFNTTRPVAIELPDGRQYKLQYNHYGELARIELPTGGTIEYDWVSGTGTGGGYVEVGGYENVPPIYRRVAERRVYSDANTLEQKTTYSPASAPQWVDGYSEFNTSVIVDHKNPSNVGGDSLSYERHYFYGWPTNLMGNDPLEGSPSTMDGREFQTDSYAGNRTTLLHSTRQAWEMNSTVPNEPHISWRTMTLADTNQVSKQTFSFDQYNNVTDTYEYDYGSGAPAAFLRRTHTDYVTSSAYTSENGPYLRSLPAQTWVSSDTNGYNKASLTTYEYDNYAADNNHAGLIVKNNVVGFDANNYGTGNTVRGNPTAVTRYANATNQTGAVTAYLQYDVLGNVVKRIDANGNASTISYDDNFGLPDDEAMTNSPPTELNGLSAFAFPTSTTNAMGWTAFSQYDYYTGAPVNTQDINGVISKMVYNDPLDRPTRHVTAVGALLESQTTTLYDDTNHRIQTTSDLNRLNDNLLKSENYYDGLGRTVETRKYEANGGYISVQAVPFLTVQDPVTSQWRAASKTSNPYRPTAGETSVWTTSLFDELGRRSGTITPDNAIVHTDYSGNTTTVTDQSGRKRRAIVNGINQLVRVDEPDNNGNLGSLSNPNQAANYSYDILGNLIQVQQNGINATQCGGQASCSQTRTFVYDSLSRQISSTNPESGSVQNTYDANGNLLTQRDSRGIKTIYDYDALNRVKKKCFRVIGTGSLGATSCSQAGSETPEPNTNDVTNTYDDSSVPFYKGKLTKVDNGISSTQFTGFDADGNITSHKQTVDGKEYSTAYSYNLGGDLIEETYPSGRVVKNTLSNDGSLSQVLSKKDSNHGFFDYAGNFTYAASGRITSMRLGNNSWESVQLNSRLQPTQIALGTTQNSVDLWKINYEFGELQANGTVDATKNNSNIAKQTISVPTVGQTSGFTATEAFTYDSLKRLATATETANNTQSWKQSFNYDQFGNRTFDAANTTTMPIGCSTAVCNPSIDPSNNRLAANQGYSHDANGNVIQSADNGKFVYDARDKIAEVRDATTNSLLSKNYYDGDGTRVKIDENNTTTTFVYDAFDKLVAEYTVNAPANPNPKVSYLTTDLLGTPRIITDENRQILSRRDLTPFGEEISAGIGGRSLQQHYGAVDGVRQKFTGQQRDEIAKLDYFNARHYAFSFGRFMSPDNFGGKLSNPQTLNLYAYALNNPLKWVDPTGHSVADCRESSRNDCTDGSGDEKPCPNCTTDPKTNLLIVPTDAGVPGSYGVSVWVGDPDSHAGPSPDLWDVSAAPDLPDSLQDAIPVWRPFRRAIYNMNCRNGSCNIDRSLSYGIQTAVEAATIWESVPKLFGKLFVKEVIEETTEIGAKSFLREPQSLMDQMVLDAAKNGAGDEIIPNLGDDAFKGMSKMSYSETSANGVTSEVHYVKDPSSGWVQDFKFKLSTTQKTNSVTQYANATKNGTIVAPR